jgi:hypothetical protein
MTMIEVSPEGEVTSNADAWICDAKGDESVGIVLVEGFAVLSE